MTSLRRVISVLFSPGKTFEDINERPTWGVVLVVLLIIGLLGSSIAVGKIDPADQERLMRDRLEDRGLSGADLDRALEQGMKVNETLRPFYSVIGVVVSLVFYLLATLVLWGGTTLAGGQSGFAKAFSTTLHGLVPQGLAGLIAIPVMLSRETIDAESAESGSILVSNLAAFAPEDTSRVLMALLSSLDFFTIWSVVLLTVGFSVTARVSKGASAAVVVGAWAIVIALKAGFAALTG